jgi:hypothetical protein
MNAEELHTAYTTSLGTCTDLLEKAIAELAPYIQAGDKASVALGYKALVTEYGSYTAQVALEYYEGMRTAAAIAQAYTPSAAGETPAWKTDMDVSDAMKSGLVGVLQGRAVQRVMERADDTLMQNALQDPARPKYAVVPQPGACGFCRLVAANGYTYATEEAAAAKSWRHNNCKCQVVVSFDGSKAPGYEPEKYTAQYDDALHEIRAEAEEQWAGMSAEERKAYADPNHQRGTYDHFLRNKVVAAMDKGRKH